MSTQIDDVAQEDATAELVCASREQVDEVVPDDNLQLVQDQQRPTQGLR